MTSDPDDLTRFRTAQDAHGTYRDALAELRAGRKRTHWMWFVFPQLAGLGRSPTAVYFAISSLDEARAYLADPVLGPRLVEAALAAADAPAASAEELLGDVDAVKLRSSMTLFAHAAPEEPRSAGCSTGGSTGGRTRRRCRALRSVRPGYPPSVRTPEGGDVRRPVVLVVIVGDAGGRARRGGGVRRADHRGGDRESRRRPRPWRRPGRRPPRSSWGALLGPGAAGGESGVRHGGRAAGLERAEGRAGPSGSRSPASRTRARRTPA